MSNTETILANATEEQIAEARDWASDCMGKSAGVKVSAERAVRYVETNYPGGWTNFLAEIFPAEPEAAQSAPVSGYTNCACRDCMDVTVSSDASKPELCSECRTANCATFPAEGSAIGRAHEYDCRRADAYAADELGDAGTGHGAWEWHSGA